MNENATTDLSAVRDEVHETDIPRKPHHVHITVLGHEEAVAKIGS